MDKNHQQKYLYLAIFLVCLLSRLLFKVVSGYDNFELFGDAPRYDMLSDRIISGNFDLDIVAFIPAPLYIYFIALCKLIAPINWQIIAVTIQFFLVSLSSIYIYKLTLLLSKSTYQSILAAGIYILYPFTLYYNFTISQETLFQSFFIIFTYYFFFHLISKTTQHLAISALVFAGAWLTKSHITILIPFILLILLKKSSLKAVVLFLSIIFICTIPHGLINLKLHDVYSFSSYGSQSLLLAGHSDETYPCLTSDYYNHPELDEEVCDLNVIFHKPYILKNFGNINSLPIKERNKKWREAAFYWIKNNPAKFWNLKWNGIKRFILPGLDYRVYNFLPWLLSFILGLLIYIPAYLVLFQKLKNDFWVHAISLAIIISIAVIFIGFYPQNRFRIITLESILIVYASFCYWRLLQKLTIKKDALS